jgi:hypothetical protein
VTTGRNMHSAISHAVHDSSPGPEREKLIRRCALGHITKRRQLDPCPICETDLGPKGKRGSKKEER